ncbi:MAG: serine/threonine protein kinase, partial [Proteobacteria bacterium]
MEGQNASMIGQIIGGRYRLTKLLGEGGMGAVYAAEHINITKTVAVKLLHPEISSNQEAVTRFKQEAQSASSIGHPNIIGIDDFFTMEDGRVCLIMEFLKGESLNDRMVVPGGLAPDQAIDLMVQVCEGLEAAHDKGIIHRDMKPENVFIATVHGREIVKILDFGIAKVTGNEDNNLTKTGTVFGTPHYMSPEQALGHKVDVRADVYSVGVMLFEIFTGQVPFQAESFMGVLSQHITKPTPAPSSFTPGRPVPPMMDDIILTAMAKEVDKRFASMGALKGALMAFRDAMHAPDGPKVVTGKVEAAAVAAAGVAAAP